MYKIIYYKTTKKVFQYMLITPKFAGVSCNTEKFAIAEVESIPPCEETESLYYEDGIVVTKADEIKVAAKQREIVSSQISEKKALLNKYREDVEQVDLFGMERADYAEKKAACKTLVEELRELEASLK